MNNESPFTDGLPFNKKPELSDISALNVEGLFGFIREVSAHPIAGSAQQQQQIVAQLAAKREAVAKALDAIAKQDSSIEMQNRIQVERIRSLFRFGGSDPNVAQILQDLLRDQASHSDSRVRGIIAAIRLTDECNVRVRAGQPMTRELIDRVFQAVSSCGVNTEFQSLIREMEIRLRDNKSVLSHLKQRQLALLEADPWIDLGIDVEVLRRQVRRLTIVGSSLILAGDTLDNRPFVWGQFEGRFVLVEFWASWCQPSVQRLQMISDFKRANPSLDFAVIGICLDIDLESCEQVVLNNQFSHVNLFSASEFERGWQHPVVAFYAVKQIPLGFLVSPDGHVLEETVSKGELQEQLQQFKAGWLDFSGQSQQENLSR